MSRPFKLRAVLRYLDRDLFSTYLKKLGVKEARPKPSKTQLEDFVKFNFFLHQFGISRMDQHRSVAVSFTIPEQMKDQVEPVFAKTIRKLSSPDGYHCRVFRESH